MKSVERVKKAIKLKKVDKIPVSFELVGETDLKEFYVGAPKNWKPKKYMPFVFDIEDYAEEKNVKKEDEWGVVWGYGETLSAGGIPIDGPLKDLEDIKDYKFPDPNGPGRFDKIQSIIENYKDKYCYITWLGLLFERLHFLHGFNKTLIDLVTNLKEVEYVLDKILQFQLELVDNLADTLKGKIHAFASTDDWGGTTNLFINPKLWRKVFKPRYAKIAEEVHKNGMDFWLHSDGKIEEIIPDLVEIGVDVFNLCTPRLLGIEEFGKKFAGKACFCLYIDTQETAVLGTKKDIIREAEDLVRYWSNEYGSGVIAMDYRGNEIYQDLYSTDVILERKRVALKTFKNAFKKKIKGKL